VREVVVLRVGQMSAREHRHAVAMRCSWHGCRGFSAWQPCRQRGCSRCWRRR
jgi:hypothetical protein